MSDVPAGLEALYSTLVDHRGPEEAISSTELADELGIEETNGNPKTRFEIRDLMEQTGLPIGACPNGYFVIDNPRDLDEYIDDLEARKDGIDERIQLVRECYENGAVEPTQSTLPTGDDDA